MNKKTIISTVGAVILGALGSGLWELIKPLLDWSWSGLLTVATLGMDSLRNEIYADAANGFPRPIGLAAGLQTIGALVFIIGSLIIRQMNNDFEQHENLFSLTLLAGGI